MSSHDDGDTDINVVSSPEPSPCPSPTNPASSNRPTSDDEAAHIPYSHLHHISRHHSRPLSITNLSTNNHLTNGDSRLSPSKTPPDTPNSGTNSILNSPIANNLSSNNNNNNNNNTTKNSGFTSFSISNILSRSDSANKASAGGVVANNEYLSSNKKQNGTQMPTTNINVTTTLGPLGHAAGMHGPHDAAMLSR